MSRPSSASGSGSGRGTILRRDDGVAAVEAAILLPVLLLLLALVHTLLLGMTSANEASRAANGGLRYATKVERNPDPDPSRECGAWSRRRSADEVRTLVIAGAGDLVTDSDQISITTDDPFAATNLCRAISGSTVRIEITYDQPLGRLGDLANSLSSWWGSQPPFPDRTHTATAVGVLE